MIRILKPITSFLIFLVVLFSITTILSITTQYPSWVCAIIALAGAVWAGWSTWQLVSGEKMVVGVAVISGALMLGGLCFIIGFLGPMALAQDTSQGPFIGIFIAAPFGVIMGAISGYIYASKQKTDAGN